MRNVLLTVTFCVISSTTLFAQDPSIIAKFVARSHSFQGVTLPYRLFIPDNYSLSRKYPLVLTLAGSSFGGTDNISQLLGGPLATAWADPVNQAKYPCFVVSPQSPTGDWTQNAIAGTVSDLLDSLTREFTIDPNRWYVTGVSAGGFGVWDMITRFPDRFAAGIPISGGGDPATVLPTAHTPIWNCHGALDNVVRVANSRDMIEALKGIGRTVVYTQCHNNDCAGLPDSTIAMYVKSHADLFYTEYPLEGHGPVPKFYGYPWLFPWVFNQYRQTPGAITITNPRYQRTLKGIETVNWQSLAGGDSVEIWNSPDAGRTWRMVSRSEPNSGSYQWDTRNFKDGAFELLKVFVKNHEGFIYGHDQSGYLTIDNGVDGTSFVKILNEEFTTGRAFNQDTMTFNLLVGDSKAVPLTVRLYYSMDGGQNFSQFDSYTTTTDTMSRGRLIHLAPLGNSGIAVIKVQVDDGKSTSSDQTFPFSKQTPRSSSPTASHIAGSGGATVFVTVVDPTHVTGNSYRVTFDDTSSPTKTYDVKNLTTGVTLVHGATELDGTTEGPQFEGLRLLIKDYPEPVVDRANTRWKIGASTLLRGSAYLPTLPVGTGEVTGRAYPADYAITFYDHVVDTSSGAFADYPAIPTNFKVQHSNGLGKGQFIFLDSDNDRKLSDFDEILILEADSVGKPFLTWVLIFTGVQGQFTLPQPGDEFDLKTLNPLTSKDVFVFLITSVQKEGVPATFGLEQNFPNPFNPTTMIKYSVPSGRDRVRGADGQIPNFSRVVLKVFDLLGREVRTLVNEAKTPGNYEVTFDGKGLASGVYFYRLEAGALIETKKLLLLR